MTPVRSLLLLLPLCAAVRAQVIVNQTEAGKNLNPEKPEEEDVRVLLQQLTARVEQLERQLEDRGRAQVAFSASLISTEEWTHQGPWMQENRLVFRKVTTNIGGAYDPNTGIFTAPVKGLYYIRFTGCVGKSGSLNAALLKNDVNMFAIFDTRGSHGSGSNGMVLVLEAGDQLSITLWSQHSIFDQSRLSTFTGFLISPSVGGV